MRPHATNMGTGTAALVHLFVAALTTALADDDAVTPRFTPSLSVLVRQDVAKHYDPDGAAIDTAWNGRRTLARVRPGLTYELSPSVTVAGRAQWYGSTGDARLQRGSIYDAWAEWRGARLSIRAGRQELAFGSGFVLGADTFYDGLSYDALRVTTRLGRTVALDVFAGRYVPLNAGGERGTLAGAYLRWSAGPALAIEAYAFRGTGHLEPWEASRQRVDTAGFRVTAGHGPFAVEFEPAWQRGREVLSAHADEAIAAFAGHVDLTCRLGAGPGAPRFVAGYAWSSGDVDGDDRYTQFQNGDNDTPILGDMGLLPDLGGLTLGRLAASGVRVASVGVIVPLGGAAVLSATVHRFRAAHVVDSPHRDLGSELDLSIGRPLGPAITLALGVARFSGGAFARDALGGRYAGTYGYGTLEVGF